MFRSALFILSLVLCLAGCSNGSDNGNSDVSPAILPTHITVEPAHANILVDTSQRFVATGTYPDGSQSVISSEVNWHSSDTGVAAVGNGSPDGGLVTALSEGKTEIIASLKTISAAATVTVYSPNIRELVIIPANAVEPVGANRQFTALLYLQGRGVVDVTKQVSWASSDKSLVSVSASGLATFLAEGTAGITASLLDYSKTVPVTVTAAKLVELQVNPVAVSVPSGVAVKFQAVGIYSDNDTSDLTRLVSWSSGDSSIATIDGSGVASTHSQGGTSIRASFESFTTEAALTVTPASVTRLQIIPLDIRAPAGTSDQLELLARYSDGRVSRVTSQAVWSSADSSVAIVQASGEQAGYAQLIAPGLTRFRASFSGLESAVEVEVLDPDPILERIQVSPIDARVAVGVAVHYQAIGIYSDGSQEPLGDEVSWQSANTAVALVDTDGLASTLAPGETSISAFYDGIYTETSLTVTAAVVTALEVVPATVSEPEGTSGHLQALAFYSDLTTENVTSLATWKSADSAVASVVGAGALAGFAQLRKEGSTEITASFSGFGNSIPVDVTAAQLTKIIVSPVNEVVPEGITVQYHAFGIYSDGTRSSLDEEVSWFSSDPTVAVITESGLALTNENQANRGVGSTVISANFAGLSDETTLTVIIPEVVSLQITPANLTEPAGTSGQLTATALYTDNRTVDVTDEVLWSSSDAAVAEVETGEPNAGLTTLIAPGEAQISAQLGSVTDTIDVVVTNAALTAIRVDPVSQSVPAGFQVQYSATGFFSDGSSSAINEDVNWQSSNIDVAAIGLDGSAIALKPGIARISASFEDVSGSASMIVNAAVVTDIQITPPALTEPAGTSGELRATALFSDNTTRNITQDATWTSSDTAVVEVQTSGVDGGFTTLIAKGDAMVSATYQGISKAIAVTVTDAVLERILIDPINSTIAEGVGLQYNATGEFSDGSTSTINSDVSWVSTDTAVATIDSAGIATGIKPGACRIRAALGAVVAEAELTVASAIVTGIQVSPPINTLSAGQEQQYQAIAVYDNAQTDDVTSVATWTTSDSKVAVISNADSKQGVSVGLLSAVGEGTADAIATFNGATGSANVTVEAAALTSVHIVANNSSIPKGLTSQWTALAHYSNNNELDITGDANWFSANTQIAAVISGEIIGVNKGSTPISIDYLGFSDSQTVNVTDPVIFSVEVSPSFSVMDVDTTQQLIATARFSDGSNLIVTDDVAWSANDDLIAQISNADGSRGVATALSVGTVDISTELNGQLFTNIAGIQVKDLVSTSLEVHPTNVSASQESNVFFKAQATYSNGSQEDVTQQVTWVSSNDNVAAIGNSPGEKGIATTKNTDGNVIITATSPNDDHIIATAMLEVAGHCSNSPPDSVTIGPDPATVSLGGSLQLVMNADFGGCIRNVTRQSGANWKVLTNKNIATVDHEGVVAGLDLGSADIEGKYKGVTDTVTVSVIATEVARLEVAPTGPLLVDVQGVVNLTCTMQQVSGGNLRPVENITDLATWEVEDSAIASLGANSAAARVVNGNRVGSTDVSCSFGGKRATVTVVVQ